MKVAYEISFWEQNLLLSRSRSLPAMPIVWQVSRLIHVMAVTLCAGFAG